MKLSRFFTLLVLDVLDFSLLTLLLVSGLLVLDVRWRLDWLLFGRFGSCVGNEGRASGCGELGAWFKKLKLKRFLLISLLGLRVEVATDSSSSVNLLSTFASFSFSFSESPIRTPLVRNARLSLFLSCREARSSGTGEVTLVPLIWVPSCTGLVAWERDVAVASQEPVGDRTAGAMFSGISTDNSR